MEVNLLLDRTKPFDETKVRILDQVVAALSSGNGAQVHEGTLPQTMEANSILEKVQEDPNFWLQCEAVLRLSQNWTSKFLCLMAVEENIKVARRHHSSSNGRSSRMIRGKSSRNSWSNL